MQRVVVCGLSSAAMLVLFLGACSGDEDTGASAAGASGSARSSRGGSGGSSAGSGGAAGEAGSGGAGSSGAGSSGASIGGAAGSTSVGGTGGSSGSDAGAGGSSSYQGGYVSVVQSIVTVSGNEYASYVFSAGFSRGVFDPGACTITDDGACRITDCTVQGGDAGTPAAETFGAGVIQLTGIGQPLQLTPDASGSYQAIVGQERLWSGGEVLTISAGGDAVPSFHETLVAAMPVTLTAPAVGPLGTEMTLSTSTSLNVSWTGGQHGQVTASLGRTVTTGTTRSVMLTCSFAATDGSGTVPASAMAVIPPGPGGTFQLMGGDSKMIQISGWSVSLLEYVPAVTLDGNSASRIVTYE